MYLSQTKYYIIVRRKTEVKYKIKYDRFDQYILVITCRVRIKIYRDCSQEPYGVLTTHRER